MNRSLKRERLIWFRSKMHLVRSRISHAAMMRLEMVAVMADHHGVAGEYSMRGGRV